ncbi:hypothetical protein ACOMHN_021244 [Nucella lapillus]
MQRFLGRTVFTGVLLFYVVFKGGATPSERCLAAYDRNSSTVFGECQKLVTAESQVSGCYWFYHSYNNQTIPYVGDLNLVTPEPGSPAGETERAGSAGAQSNRSVAVCVLQQVMPRLPEDVDPVFSVRFSPDWAKISACTIQTLQEQRLWNFPFAGKICQSSRRMRYWFFEHTPLVAVETGMKRPSDVTGPDCFFVIIDCLISVAVIIVVLRIVLIVRQNLSA